MSADGGGTEQHDNNGGAADGGQLSEPGHEARDAAESDATAHLQQEADEPFPVRDHEAPDISEIPTQPLPEIDNADTNPSVGNDVTDPGLGNDVSEIRTSPLPDTNTQLDDDYTTQPKVTEPLPETDVSTVRTSPLPGQDVPSNMADTQPAPAPRPEHPSERDLTDPHPSTEAADISTRPLPGGEGDFYGAPTEANTLPAAPSPPIDQQDTLGGLARTQPGPDRE